MCQPFRVVIFLFAFASALACNGSGGNGSLTRGLLLPCSHPAPLAKPTGPMAPGYLVQLHDGVDVTAETQRLAALYSFTPGAVLPAVQTFVAILDEQQLDSVRCEATVQGVFYNGFNFPQ